MHVWMRIMTRDYKFLQCGYLELSTCGNALTIHYKEVEKDELDNGIRTS